MFALGRCNFSLQIQSNPLIHSLSLSQHKRQQTHITPPSSVLSELYTYSLQIGTHELPLSLTLYMRDLYSLSLCPILTRTPVLPRPPTFTFLFAFIAVVVMIRSIKHLGKCCKGGMDSVSCTLQMRWKLFVYAMCVPVLKLIDRVTKIASHLTLLKCSFMNLQSRRSQWLTRQRHHSTKAMLFIKTPNFDLQCRTTQLTVARGSYLACQFLLLLRAELLGYMFDLILEAGRLDAWRTQVWAGAIDLSMCSLEKKESQPQILERFQKVFATNFRLAKSRFE